jgi:hypothetical protein
MDDESKQLLREILDLQKQQMALLRMWLPQPLRIRFSLRALLIALTLVALFLGIIAFLNRAGNNARKPPIVPVTKQIVS